MPARTNGCSRTSRPLTPSRPFPRRLLVPFELLFPFARRFLLLLTLLAPETADASGAPDAVWIGAGDIGVRTVALPADGRYVASGSYEDETVKIWDRSGGIPRTFAAHLAGVQDLAVTADGALLVSAGDVAVGSGDPEVKLWDVATGQVIRGFDTGDETAWSVALSPDGGLLAAGVGFGGEIRIWRVSDGVLLHVLLGHTWSVFDVAFSPDGTLLASASGDNTARIWRVADGASLRTLTGHTFFVQAVAFSPDGSLLATGSWDNTARIWRVADGVLLRTLADHLSFVASVAFSADGSRLATGSWDRSIRVWRTAGWTVERTLTVPGLLEVNSVSFGDDPDLLASGGVDGHPRVFRISDGSQVDYFGHHVGTVRGLGYSSDGSLLASACGDFTGRIWQTSTGADLVTLTGHEDVVNAIAFLPGDATVATGAGSPGPDTRDPSVRVWRVSDGALLRVLAGHEGGTTGVAKSPDGAFIVSCGRDGNIKFWRITDGVLDRSIAAHAFGLSDIEFSPNGQILASAAGAQIRLWQMPAMTLIRTVSTSNAVSSLCFSPDGAELAVAEEGYDHNVKVWSVVTGDLLRSLTGHPDGFCASVSWSRDGLVIASGSPYSRDVRIWRAADGALLALYDRETGWGPNPTLPLVFSPDSRRLAIGRTDATVLLARNPFVPASDVEGPGAVGAATRSSLGLTVEPNPAAAGSGVTIRFEAPTAGVADAVLVDAQGRIVRTLARGASFVAGRYALAWDGRDATGLDVPSGIYFVRVCAGGTVASVRLVVTR